MSYAQVLCRGDSIEGQEPCGIVPLTEAQYLHQLAKGDSPWFCPQCGSNALFDDEHFEEQHP